MLCRTLGLTLMQYIKHETPCFITFPNTDKSMLNIRLEAEYIGEL